MTCFTIVGAGGIGTAVGVMLQAAGHPTTLVCRHPAEVEEINARGAGVFGCCEQEARPRAVVVPLDLTGDDVLVLAVKAHQTADALAGLRGMPRAALTLQNGIGKERPLIERFGCDRVIASVIQVTATWQAPGRSRCASIAPSAISALDASGVEAAGEIAAAFTNSGMPATVVRDAVEVEWAKAAQWLPSALLSAATGLSLDAVLRDEGLARAYVAMVRECAEVARRHGRDLARFGELYARRLTEMSFDEGVQTLVSMGEEMATSELAGYRTAMELDLARGIEPEVAPTAGVLEAAARTVGVACPVLQTAHTIVRARASQSMCREQLACA